MPPSYEKGVQGDMLSSVSAGKKYSVLLSVSLIFNEFSNIDFDLHVKYLLTLAIFQKANAKCNLLATNQCRGLGA